MACCPGACRCLSPCCAAPCEPAVPFCSRPPSPMRIQYVGEPKLCSILCAQGVDEPFKHNCKKYHYQGYNRFTDKLGYPVGVLRSLVASSDKALFFDDNEMNGQRYAMCMKAFAMLHLMPVNEWERPVLDSLMHEGAELYSQGAPESTNRDNERGDEFYTYGDSVYSKEEAGVRRAFKMKGYEFEVELSEKFIPSIEEPLASGDTLSDISVTTLRQALFEFFRDKRFCLLSTTNLYLLIWKVDGMFFVLDFYGRTPTKLELQRDGGYATLLCLRLVDNIYYLIAQKSNIGKREIFSLREMRMVMLVDPEGRAQTRAFGAKRTDQFVVVSDQYAYLRSALHLSLRENDPLLSRCALPIAIAAIMASKIDHPAAWDEKTLDKIICYGFFVCRCCWEFCQNSQTPIDFDSFPNQLQIGQFAVSLTLIPRAYQGKWNCVPLYNNTDLSALVTKCFENGENHLLIAINHQTYAIWKKNGYYYLFDPYRHRLPGTDARSASLRMFASLPLFLNILNMTLLQSNPSATFYIHRVVITEIKVSLTSECLTSAPIQVCPEDIRDAKSINEIICFREDYKRCLADLGQESDDELSDSFDEADLEEVEEEEPIGEEEEEGGMLSGFEDVSDEDGRRLRRQPRKGKGRRDMMRRDKEGRRKDREGRDREGQGKGRKGKGRGKRGKSRGGDDDDDDGGGGGKKKKGKGKGKNDNREKAGTTDSEKEKEEEARRKKLKSRASRSSRRESRRRSSRRPSARRRSKRSRRSKSTDDDKTVSSRSSRRTSKRPSRRASRRGSRRTSRRSKSRESKKLDSKDKPGDSKSRKSQTRESRPRLSKGRRSKSRDSKGRRSKSRDGKGEPGRDDSGRRDGHGRDGDRDGGRRGDDRDGDGGGRRGDGRDGDGGGRTGDSRDRDGGRRGDSRDRDGGRKGDDRDGDGARRGDRDGDGGRRGDSRDRDGGRRGDGRDGDGGGRFGDRDGDGGRRGDGRDGDGGGRYGDRDGDGGRRADGRDGDRGGKYGDRDGDGGRRGDRGGRGGRYSDDDSDREKRKRKYGDGDDRRRRGSDSGSSLDGYGSDDSLRRLRGSEDVEYDEEGRVIRRRRRRRDESDEDIPPAKGEVVCRPNAYPGYSTIPYNMCVCGSESGTYESICKLLRAGFKCADRVLLMTPWGNFVVFRGCSMFKRTYFLFDGCTCNVERFRHLDLYCGTAGLLCFNNLHRVITYIIDSRNMRKCLKKSRQEIIEEICQKYCKK